jgi:hypothetical protein
MPPANCAKQLDPDAVADWLVRVAQMLLMGTSLRDLTKVGPTAARCSATSSSPAFSTRPDRTDRPAPARIRYDL